jgi:xanthine dehydrogenase YagR molybdenum-binding subunit
MKAAARVRIMPDGTALVQSGTQDIGTGTYTIMTQVAADALGLPLDKVRAELGDSDFPKAPVSGGSMTAASVMPAVQAAARDALGKLFALAAKKGGAAWTQNDSDTVLILREGNVEGPAGLLRIADLLGGQKFVEGTAETKLADDAKKYSRHAFGAQFAEVHVDPDLGTVRVVRFVGAFDGGRILNAKTARSQLIGGIVFGMGMALFEETRVDGRTARITNSNIADYLMPVNADVTMVETIMVQSDDPITDPLGAKGIGELPMVGAAPAIANAVYHATGIRVRELPIRIDKLIDAPLPSQRAALQ